MSARPLVGIDASRSYRSPMTGTERYSQHLIEHLLSLEEDRVSYRLYFDNPPPDDALLGNASVRTLRARRFWTHYRLSRELREHPVDLLFVPSHVLPILRPERSVVTVHDLGYLYEPETHTRSGRIQLKMTTLWNARMASHLIAISESTRQDLIENCNVRPERITVVQHGVEERFTVLSAENVEQYRLAAKLPEQFVLYLGTVQPRKNLNRLIEAFELVASGDPEPALIIAGKFGWLAQPIIDRVGNSRFRDRIRLLGYVPDEQLPLLYNAASALATPSLYEGFGLPVLEAMACGTPVVISDRGALPELAGADSVTVDPTNVGEIAAGIAATVASASNESAIRHRVAFAGRFRWEASARATRAVLMRQLFGGGQIE